MILTEGILRARYRESFTVPELLEPGGGLRAPAGSVGDGERVSGGPPHPTGGLEQQFPTLRPQQQHGRGHRNGTRPQYRSAINRILHDAAHPSHLILPIIKR